MKFTFTKIQDDNKYGLSEDGVKPLHKKISVSKTNVYTFCMDSKQMNSLSGVRAHKQDCVDNNKLLKSPSLSFLQGKPSVSSRTDSFPGGLGSGKI